MNDWTEWECRQPAKVGEVWRFGFWHPDEMWMSLPDENGGVSFWARGKVRPGLVLEYKLADKVYIVLGLTSSDRSNTIELFERQNGRIQYCYDTPIVLHERSRCQHSYRELEAVVRPFAKLGRIALIRMLERGRMRRQE